jgi:hypothetical protein
MHTFYIIFWASNENICSLSTPLTKRGVVDREQIFGNQITHRFSGRAKKFPSSPNGIRDGKIPVNCASEPLMKARSRNPGQENEWLC